MNRPKAVLVRFARQVYFLLLLGMAISLAGCTGTPAQPANLARILTPVPTPTPSQRGTGGTLDIMFWQAPTILNPHLATANKDWAAARVTYEPLASFDKDGNLVPFLAAELPSLQNGGVAKNGTSVTWKLRPGLLWSDGTPLTAADVKFTYDYITNPSVGATTAGAYADVAGVDVLDPTTVRVNFKHINPGWALPFVGIAGMILPQHVFGPYNGPNAGSAPANLKPVGSGPYRVVSFEPQEVIFLGNSLVQTNKIIYEPNPFFRDPGKPYFSRVQLLGGGTTDEAARSVLQFGDVDYANDLQIDDVLQRQLELYGNGKIVSSFGPYVEHLEFNMTDPNRAAPDGERSTTLYQHPFFNDSLVRQAFAYAIDRKAIAALYGPTGRATGNILVSPPAYESSDTANLYGYNLQKAGELLDQAGWLKGPDGIRRKNGVRMSVVFQTSANSVRQQTQRIIAQAFGSLGIDTQLAFYDAGSFFDNDPGNTHNLHHFYADIQELANGNQNPYPGPYMAAWTCAEIAQKSNNWTGANEARWCNPAYDLLFQQSTRELDPERSRQLFISMNNLLVNDAVAIPLVRQADIAGVSRSLVGVDWTPWDADLWNIQDWRRASS
jgi:peptide/nickel transport system substrate-binding protein